MDFELVTFPLERPSYLSACQEKKHSVSGILVKREALALGALVSGTRLCQFLVGDLGQSANLFLCLFSPLYKKESDIDFSGLQRGPIRWHE